VASLLIGKPVKWVEDRSENLQADSFARDYHITAEMAVDNNGKITGLRVNRRIRQSSPQDCTAFAQARMT
jgi:carbon-monoxide dehydrogenase large subunit